MTLIWAAEYGNLGADLFRVAEESLIFPHEEDPRTLIARMSDTVRGAHFLRPRDYFSIMQSTDPALASLQEDARKRREPLYGRLSRWENTLYFENNPITLTWYPRKCDTKYRLESVGHIIGKSLYCGEEVPITAYPKLVDILGIGSWERTKTMRFGIPHEGEHRSVIYDYPANTFCVATTANEVRPVVHLGLRSPTLLARIAEEQLLEDRRELFRKVTEIVRKREEKQQLVSRAR